MRIAVTAERPDPSGRVDLRLWRAPFLVIYDTHDGSWEALDNRTSCEKPGDAAVAVAELLAQHRVDVVLCEVYGPKAYEAFQNVGIRLRDGASGTVREAVDRYLAPKIAGRSLV